VPCDQAAKWVDMFTSASSKYLVVAGVIAAAATMGVGVASAGPDLSPIINTTCSYEQVTAALNVVSPDMAAKLAQNPMVRSRLQAFLAAPIDERQQMAQQAMARGGGGGGANPQQILSTLTQVANVCHNY
jgi:hemophore-related protein